MERSGTATQLHSDLDFRLLQQQRVKLALKSITKPPSLATKAAGKRPRKSLDLGAAAESRYVTRAISRANG